MKDYKNLIARLRGETREIPLPTILDKEAADAIEDLMGLKTYDVTIAFTSRMSETGYAFHATVKAESKDIAATKAVGELEAIEGPVFVSSVCVEESGSE